MNRVLISGGSGFIGTNLAKYLQDKDYYVSVLDNLSVSKEQYLFDAGVKLHPNDFIVNDIREPLDFSGIDVLVHLASFTGVAICNQNPKDAFDVNVNGTLNLLELCRKYNIGKFIFASTNAVLGNQSCPFHESQIPRPLSVYGASKMTGEALCSAYWHSFGIKTLSLRFSNCYGFYSDHKTSVIRKFINNLKNKESLIIYGDGQQTRDFVWAEDVCQAIHLCIESNLAGGSVFHVGSGVPTKISDLAYSLIEISGTKSKIVFESKRKEDIVNNYSDISYAGAFLGYKPRMELNEGLKLMWGK